MGLRRTGAIGRLGSGAAEPQAWKAWRASRPQVRIAPGISLRKARPAAESPGEAKAKEAHKPRGAGGSRWKRRLGRSNGFIGSRLKVPPVPAAPPTADENERLQALQDMQILDTAPEARFDRITRLASLLFDVPISLVSLVDEDRQWFKSCIGLDEDQTERDASFCAHAIHSPEVFIVSDARKDERFADNRLVTGPPFIQFYAGRPLNSPGGHLVGTLCIIDTKPRTMSAEDIHRLDALGQWVELELQNRSLGERETINDASRRHQFWRLSKDLLCIAGTDGFFKDLSPSFTTTLGYTRDRLLGQPFLDFVHGDDVAATMSEMERLRDGQSTLHFRNRYRHENGHYIWLDWTAVPSGNVIYAVARDVTEAVENRNRLDRVVGRLQDSTSQMREFATLVAHDLRAPLRRLAQQGLNEEAAQEIDLLNRMIEDLVRYERVFLAEVPEEVINLDELWDEVADAFSDALARAQVVVERPLGNAFGNWEQLAVVMRNLVDNSIKYKHPNRPLQIRVQAFPQADGVEIHYRDDGQGIPPEVAAKLWTPFQGRAPGRGEDHGMGMPLVKRILERHGGSIRVGTPPRGAHFVLFVPARAKPVEAPVVEA